MKPNIYHYPKEHREFYEKYDDQEDLDEFADVTWWEALQLAIFIPLVYCIIFFCDAYRAYKRLHPVVKGLIWSAIAGIGIGLLIVLTIFLILEY